MGLYDFGEIVIHVGARPPKGGFCFIRFAKNKLSARTAQLPPAIWAGFALFGLQKIKHTSRAEHSPAILRLRTARISENERVGFLPLKNVTV